MVLFGLPALGTWMLFTSAMGAFGAAQAMFSTTLLKNKQFSKAKAQVTPIVHRTFAVWTLLATVVRAHCAFDLYNPSLYRVALISYMIAAGFYIWETFVARTVPMSYALPAFCIAGISTVWMTMEYAVFTKGLY
jgi:hypothetical protein